MKTKTIGLGSLVSTALLLSAAMVPAKVALADFGDAQGFQVDPGRTTNTSQHDNASYMVFRSAPDEEMKFGILFMQTQGSYPYQPFLCVNAEINEDEEFIRCTKQGGEIPGLQIREQVTIGHLPGSFCQGLRDEHNPEVGDDVDPIMEENDCGEEEGPCSCYQIMHLCRLNDEDEWDEDHCPDLAEAFSNRLRSRVGDANIGFAPPSRGAGSGGSN